MWSIIAIPIFAMLGSAFSGGDSSLVIRIDHVNIDNKENAYFGEWIATIHPGDPENQISMKMPIKSDIPDNIIMQYKINLDGDSVVDTESSLCEGIKDDVVAAGIIAAGIPKDSFPKDCPIGPGDYEVDKYSVVKDNLPQGMPDGKFDGSVSVKESDKEPFMIITFDGEMYHKVSGMK